MDGRNVKVHTRDTYCLGFTALAQALTGILVCYVSY